MSDANARRDPLRTIRRLNWIGLGVIVVFAGGFAGWAATSRLSSAVIAHGVIVVESSVKKVQHPTGGVVRELLVEEGSPVAAGDVVLRLDDTVPRATLGIVSGQLDEATARLARLKAERDGSDAIDFPRPFLDRQSEETVAAAIAGERKLFESRRTSQDGQRQQLRERIAQTRQEMNALTAQLDANHRQSALVDEELVGVGDLYEKQLTSITRLMDLQREKARLEGERGQFTADIARAGAKISETELQILQLDQDFRTSVLGDLRETEGKIAELQERVITAKDDLMRIDVRAPLAGIVHELTVHSKNAVITPGETIMEIVPTTDDLVVDARFAPSDIDQIVVGAETAVRISAGNQRTTPYFVGHVIQVSPDLSHDQRTDQPYFLVRVALQHPEPRQLGDLKLLPGMQAEVFVTTGERTPLEYIIKPLREQIARTFRER
jgi:HlyD family secretion protein